MLVFSLTWRTNPSPKEITLTRRKPSRCTPRPMPKDIQAPLSEVGTFDTLDSKHVPSLSLSAVETLRVMTWRWSTMRQISLELEGLPDLASGKLARFFDLFFMIDIRYRSSIFTVRGTKYRLLALFRGLSRTFAPKALWSFFCIYARLRLLWTQGLLTRRTSGFGRRTSSSTSLLGARTEAPRWARASLWAAGTAAPS